MKILSLILWVGQFGFSVLFPFCFFLWLAWWLMNRFALGMWVMVVLGMIGFLTSISTAKSCLRSILKEMERSGSQKKPPTAFNDHS